MNMKNSIMIIIFLVVVIILALAYSLYNDEDSIIEPFNYTAINEQINIIIASYSSLYHAQRVVNEFATKVKGYYDDCLDSYREKRSKDCIDNALAANETNDELLRLRPLLYCQTELQTITNGVDTIKTLVKTYIDELTTIRDSKKTTRDQKKNAKDSAAADYGTKSSLYDSAYSADQAAQLTKSTTYATFGSSTTAKDAAEAAKTSANTAMTSAESAVLNKNTAISGLETSISDYNAARNKDIASYDTDITNAEATYNTSASNYTSLYNAYQSAVSAVNSYVAPTFTGSGLSNGSVVIPNESGCILFSPGLSYAVYNGYFEENHNLGANDYFNWFTSQTATSSGITTKTGDMNECTNGTVPGVDRRDRYSVELKGYLRVQPQQSGTWSFELHSDDAAYLWIGENALFNSSKSYDTIRNSALINHGGLHGPSSRYGSVTLTNTSTIDKFFPIRIQMAENYGNDRLTLKFKPPNLDYRTDGTGFYFSGSTNVDCSSYAAANNSAALEAAQTAAYNAYQTALTEKNNKEQALTNAKNAKANAQAAKTTAETNYNTALGQLDIAEEELELLKQDLSSKTTAYNNASAAYDAALAAYNTANQTYLAAVEALRQTGLALTAADDAKKQAKIVLDTKTEELRVAQNELDTAETNLSNAITEGNQINTSAQAYLTDATRVVNEVQTTLNTMATQCTEATTFSFKPLYEEVTGDSNCEPKKDLSQSVAGTLSETLNGFSIYNENTDTNKCYYCRSDANYYSTSDNRCIINTQTQTA